MSIQTTLAEFRTDISCDIIQMPDTTWLRYYNYARDRLIESIKKENEDYFYNYINTSTVVNQNEYKLPIRWDLAQDWITILDWLTNIKAVSWKIKSTDTEYTVLKAKSLENLEKDIESYDTTTEPFFCLMDNSIFIYPAPTEATDLKVYWTVHYKKVWLTDTERLTDIAIRCIFYGVKSMYLENQNRIQEAQVAQWKFESEIINICNSLSWRIIWPIQRTIPDITNLK